MSYLETSKELAPRDRQKHEFVVFNMNLTKDEYEWVNKQAYLCRISKAQVIRNLIDEVCYEKL